MLDLTDALLADVRGPTGTAWIPEGAKVLRSGYYKFFDEPCAPSAFQPTRQRARARAPLASR
jgi:hypothetical protein